MSPTHANIVSHTEKRTRIRVVSAHRNSANMKKFVAAIKTLPCVDKVHTRAHTGSLLIEHKGGTRDQFKGVFEDIGCILRSTLFLDLPEGIKEPKNLDLPQAIRDLDSRMGFKDSPFRLSNLFPFSLAALAFIQLRRQRFQFIDTPWYILAYLAYYTFTTLHKGDNVTAKGTEN